MAELRFDPLRNRWVVIDPERGERGGYFIKDTEKDLYTKKSCPFCPGNEHLIPNPIISKESNGKWSLKVIPNKFPVFMVEKSDKYFSVGPYESKDNVGAHEVIIETPEHDITINNYPKDKLKDILNIVKERLLDLRKDMRLKYITMFKNYRFLAGASLKHPHSQIMGMPVVPFEVEQEIVNSSDFFRKKGRCLFCDILRFESEDKRIIEDNERFTSFIPYASKYPFQIDIYPKKHLSDFSKTTLEDIELLSDMLHTIFTKMNKSLGDIPLNIVIKTVPVNIEGTKYQNLIDIDYSFHWRLEIIPRINKFGGIECALGMHINPISPEKAAIVLNNLNFDF